MADSTGPTQGLTEQEASQFYSNEPPTLRPEAREVLEKYSKIPPEEIEAHVRSIRDKAWSIHHYPCIGQWRFLDLFIGTHPLYPEILSRMLTHSQTYLDLGCAFAGDIRLLVSAGVDSGKCYGSDYQSSFIDLGYDLFKDRETLKSKFVVGDIFDPESELKRLEGEIDIIGASSFFHLFSWQDQKTVALRAAKLLKSRKGSLIVGRQIGDENPGDFSRGESGRARYRHNDETWRQFWREVGEEIGVEFEVEVESGPAPGSVPRPGVLLMRFSVRRL